MPQNINRVIITGNLTRDPELRNLPSGSKVCDLRVACNGRRKNGTTGAWEDDPNFFNVSVWGQQGENCARYLAKGRGVAIDGRLNWREWESEGQKRQAVDITAETVQFLGGGNGEGNGGSAASAAAAASDIPVDTADFVSAPGGHSDDDIPF
jgi:single-strand DNA-binding protein